MRSHRPLIALITGAAGVAVVSDRSFGIFLAHPLILWILLWIGDGWVGDHVPKPWLTLVAYITVALVVYGISTAARRSPLSLPFAGRPWRRRPPGRANSASATPPART